MPATPFELTRPAVRRTAVVFASPHSGRCYDNAFLTGSRLDALSLRSSEDAFVDQLFDQAPAAGAPLLAATMPRAFVDLNRAPEELDPALIEGVRRLSQNARVQSGLGVVPRVVAGGRAIYEGRIPLAEAHRRITTYWRPYHDQLQTLLDEARRDFGRSILIDCHSMPRLALEQASRQGTPPDVVIGDRYGAAASPRIVQAVEQVFETAGLKTARNTPFAGAYIAQAYGRPSRRQHAVQIEIDRSLYMNEDTLKPSADFDAFKRVIDALVVDLAEIGASDGSVSLAAE